ncbi:hypothetical protein LTR08_003443 [Meristemomyces frigidus]|nr:hypothetical protein LTR08_003443 [Meristemomyces frigidus]
MIATGSVPAGVARPYKDFLTPALHRRFTNAAALTLALCWLEASLMSSDPSYFRAVFPLSRTGLRTLLLLIPCLAVFIIRVMNMHVGQRTTCSGVETLLQRGTDWRTAGTMGWYVFSAWMFGEVYIWSSSEGANLGWIDHGRAYERAKANENPVFLRTVFFVFALVQAGWHLLGDRDRLAIEERDHAIHRTQERQDSRLPESLRQLGGQAGSIAHRTVPFVLCGSILTFPVYFLVLRKLAWKYMAYPIARTLVRHLPANAGPSGLLNVGRLAWQCLASSAMLIILWEVSNAIFTISVSQAPLKKGQPLTSEIKDARGVILSKSKDPNGSLIRGLKAQKDTPKSFAFWELDLICTVPAFEHRRKTIFTDVDRKPSTTWSQISALCLAEISAINTRIVKSQAPLEQQQQTAASAVQQEHLLAPQKRAQSFGLPRIASQGVQENASVFAATAPGSDALQTVGNLARSIGQSPGAQSPVIPSARKAIAWTERQTTGGSLGERWSSTRLSKGANGYVLQFLKSPLGEPWRQTFARRVCAVVFGIPHSGRTNIVHASRALTALTVASLKEDKYGQVARDIPAVIRTYTAAIVGIRKLVAELPPHWTDVRFASDDSSGGGAEAARRVEEVEAVVEVLRRGLEQVVLAFGEYAAGLGLGAREMREAREVIATAGRRRGEGGEMRERRRGGE